MLPYTGHFAQQNSGAGHSPLLLFIIHGGAMNTVPRGYSAQPEIRRWRMSGSWCPREGSNLDQSFRKALFYPLNYRDTIFQLVINLLYCATTQIFTYLPASPPKRYLYQKRQMTYF